MRIGTWNLECGGRTSKTRADQAARVRQIDADVMVFTEPGSDRAGNVIESPATRQVPGGRAGWVAIVGDGLEAVGDPLPYARMSAVARTVARGSPIVVYGSVLPWRGIRAQAPDLISPHESYAEAFERVLREQVADVRALVQKYPGELVVWAGDFNQSLEGPNFGGSKAGRALLRAALDDLGFEAWNSSAPHARPPMCAIDLVCGPPGRATRVEQIDPDGLSDHVGYVVELTAN